MFITLDAHNKKEAIEQLKKRYPNENIEMQLEAKKIVIASSIILPTDKPSKIVRGYVFCKNCQKMHREGSKVQKRCNKIMEKRDIDYELMKYTD